MKLAAALVIVSVTHALAEAAPVGTGCEWPSRPTDQQISDLINEQGLREFENPEVVRPVSEASKLELVVGYAVLEVAGCTAQLRTYNGKLVGPTIKASPGDTLFIRLVNNLPMASHPHPQDPPPPEHTDHFSFNITNLHTHGLHVAPEGDGPVNPATGRRYIESDNVLLELPPGEVQEYRIEIPTDHAAGTFWYHAHVHGGTAIQVGSGMAGALIIDGGEAEHGDLDAIPAVAAAAASEKVMLVQQIWMDESGEIENLPSKRRPTLVNGQLVPRIKMRPGEFQRWRLIHAGVQENLALTFDGHDLNEVSADGISLGRLVPWPSRGPDEIGGRRETLFLAPGYRSDVLVQLARDAEPGKTFYLRTHRLPRDESIQVMNARAQTPAGAAGILATDVTPDDLIKGQILVEVLIEGEPVSADLPTKEELSRVVPSELIDITEEEIARTLAVDPSASRSITFSMRHASCDPSDGTCVPCTPGADGCDPFKLRFMVNDRQFTMTNGIPPLKLRTGGEWTAAEWTVSSGEYLPAAHPFHIHVNPFQVQRTEPDGVTRWRWKDTWLTFSDGTPGTLRMRYRVFTGKFVLHCHILGHEDQGMMSVVEIVDN